MNSARILIVEDDAVLATHLDEMLNQMGYQVTGLAATGEQAIQSALDQSPDVILMDIRLRGKMNGIQATEEIHKSADIPVVYLTAYTDESLLQQAKLTDAYAYLAKPVRDHELRASLEMALYKHQSEKQILHLNRVLHAVRDVNQLITRERDPQRLMDEACNILVRTRDYKLAWIGQTVGDRLKPIASAGEGKDVIELIFATASEKQVEKLPGMESLRTKQPVVSHNIPSDDRYAPWREKMEQRKLFSRAAIPMITGDRHLGVLSVYSEYETVFNEAETSLLMELAGDLAFGLSSIEEELERKQAEMMLQESEERYRTTLNNMMEGCQIIDHDWHYIYINDTAAKQGKREPNDLLARTMMEVYPGIEETEMFSVLKRCMAERRVERIENKFIYPDGSFAWFELSIQPAPEGLFILSVDITERKRVEEMRANLAAIVESSDDAIIGKTLDGTITSWNYGAQNLYGYSADEAIGQSVSILIPPDRPNELSDTLSRLKLGEKVERYETVRVRKNGMHLDVSVTVSPIIDNLGRVIGASSIARNITERKRAEEALRESESRFRTFIEQAPIAISVSRNGRGLYANQKFLQLIGLQSIEESVGRPILEYFAPQVRDESKERSRRRSLGLPVPTEFESIILHIDGSQSPVQIAIAQVHLSDGVANIAFVTDITERKMAEKRIKRQIEQLTALNEIDRMITSSFNLQLNLTSIIDRVISQQKVDAADILLMNPDLNILEFGAGHGFRTLGIEKSHLSLGEGYAGRAALERQTIHIPDLRTQTDNMTIRTKLANDNFVSYYAVPLVAKGKVKGVLEIFNRSPLNPDFEWLDFLNTLAGQAAIAIDNATLFGNLQRSNTELAMAYDATIEGWSRALDMRDKETEGHSLRVTEMASILASKFGIQDQELVQIRWGALLHDIGKMGVPDGILLKPDALTEQEWKLMKSHPALAYKLLSPIGFLRSAVDIPYCHHEKWDGSGYPRGLKGEQIPLSARIFAVIDVWDALTSDRVYRKAWSDEKALEYIRTQSGIHFDPKVVKVCLESGILERRSPK